MNGTDGSPSGVIPAGPVAVGRAGPEDGVDMARPVRPQDGIRLDHLEGFGGQDRRRTP